MRTVQLWWAMVVVLLVGCGTATFVVQQYDGAAKPSHLVAVLRMTGEDRALVVSLDGEQLKNGQMEHDVRVHVEMLPGVHEVGIAYAGSPVLIAQHVQFRAEQGKFYRAVAVDTPAARRSGFGPGVQWQAHVYEIDRDTDALVRDVSLQEERRRGGSPPGDGGAAHHAAAATPPAMPEAASAGAPSGGASSAGTPTSAGAQSAAPTNAGNAAQPPTAPSQASGGAPAANP